MRPVQQILLSAALIALVACGAPPSGEGEAATSPSDTTNEALERAERVSETLERSISALTETVEDRI